ncbi:diguanylate cyclase [Methylobacterium phyllosphaerae]
MTSDPNQQKRPNLGTLPEFQIHRTNLDAGLILSGPTASRLTGEPIIRMTRRIWTPDGTFAGIVSGSIALAHFQALFDRLRFEDGLALNVFHRDGTLLIRAPARPGSLGQSISASEGYRIYRTQARGEFLGRSFLDDVERLYSFANLVDLPLIVSVATNVDSIRAVWIYKAAIVGVLILCLCVLTFGLTILLHREMARQAATEASTRAANAALAVLARTDGLTGLPNRRSYDEHFATEWRRAAQFRTPLALMIVDADHFKQFNDRFGHQRGDEVLKAVADCLHRALDAQGLSFRIGGEEFVVLLPGLDATAAVMTAERLRRAVANLRIPHAADVGGLATVSIGVACADPGAGHPPEALFVAADAALYAAKKAGRNRVRAAPSADPMALARRA